MRGINSFVVFKIPFFVELLKIPKTSYPPKRMGYCYYSVANFTFSIDISLYINISLIHNQ